MVLLFICLLSCNVLIVSFGKLFKFCLFLTTTRNQVVFTELRKTKSHKYSSKCIFVTHSDFSQFYKQVFKFSLIILMVKDKAGFSIK